LPSASLWVLQLRKAHLSEPKRAHCRRIIEPKGAHYRRIIESYRLDSLWIEIGVDLLLLCFLRAFQPKDCAVTATKYFWSLSAISPEHPFCLGEARSKPELDRIFASTGDKGQSFENRGTNCTFVLCIKQNLAQVSKEWEH